MNTNGILSFDTAVPDYSSNSFPFRGPGLIAPFWADVDTRGTGEVFYSESSAMQGNIAIGVQTAIEIQIAFEEFKNFTPTSVFTATWNSVGYFENKTDLVRSTHA